MAKLPDETALGPLPSAASSRPIATYDTTGYARGAAAIGAGVSDIGKGVTAAEKDILAVQFKQSEKTDELDVAKAQANYLVQTKQIRDQLSGETDPSKLEQTYAPQFQKVQADSAALITNPRARELWTLKTAPDVTGHQIAVGDKTFELETTREIAGAQDRLEQIRQAALKTNDPAARSEFIKTGHQLIGGLQDAGYIDATTAQKYRSKWTQDYATGAIEMLTPPERVAVLDGFGGALKNRESSGNPGKVNQLGYAGLYQFGAPRLADMGVYTPGKDESLDGWSKAPANAPGKWSGEFNIPGRPDIKTLKDFLGSPSAQEQAFQIHTGKMDQEIQSNGLEKYIGQTVGGTVITRDGLHAMMHLGGAGGAKRALESDGRDSPKDANGTSVIDYAKLGSQSGLAKVAAFLPEDTRVKMRLDAQNEVDRTGVKNAMARSEVYDRSITDASAGLGVLPPRSSIENDPQLDEPRRNTLLKQYDSAAGDVVKFERAMTKFRDPNAGTFNPFDKDDRDNSDKIYKVLGGNEAALQTVVQRTGLVPKSAVVEMRGGLSSADPSKVESSLQLAANLTGGNKPDIFAGIDGGKELSDAGLAFRHYVYDRGMSAADATKKIMEERTPEYEQKIKARIKSEDVNAIVKKELNDGDIRSAFDPSFLGLAPNPALTFNPEMRQRAMGDYEEVFRENFAKNGDVALSKKLAQDEMKKTWGVTNVNGSKVVMKYPPERSPAYQGIENPSEHIAAQALAAIKEWNGASVSNAGSTAKPAGNLLEQAQAKYPILKNQDYGYTENFKPNSGFLEHWDPGEPGSPSSADKPLDGTRPNSLPIDKHGLEIRDPKTRPIDILGDIVSHNLIHTDPVVKAAYDKLEGSLTPKQLGILQDQYGHAQKQQGETRSFADWKDASGMPGFFRGYTFQQWPKDFNDKAYTTEQRSDLDNLMKYLSKGGTASGETATDMGIDRSKLRLDEVKNTGERYMRGEAPTYVLSYTDKNGHVQTIPKQFYADPNLMRDVQTSKRAAESAQIQARVNINEDMADLNRAPFGVAR